MNTKVLETSVYYSEHLTFISVYYNSSSLVITYENNKITKSDMFNDITLLTSSTIIPDLTALDADEFFQLSTVWEHCIPIELARAIQKNIPYIMEVYKTDYQRFKEIEIKY